MSLLPTIARVGDAGGVCRGDHLSEVDQVANPLQVGDQLHRSENVPGCDFRCLGNGIGSLSIDAVLELVQFLLTLLHRQEGYAAGIGQKVVQVERCVACHQDAEKREFPTIG